MRIPFLMHDQNAPLSSFAPLAAQSHLHWIDFLRVLACFLVVLAHCCDPFVSGFDRNPTDFFSGVFWGSLLRPSVPLFVMITGILLLPVKMDMTSFYKKRLKRILIPLISWSVILPFLFYFYVNSGIDTPNPNIVASEHTLGEAATKLYTFLFNFNYSTIPLWYLYMLVGLYLFMPIISAWIQQARRKDVKCFLWMWGVAMALPYVEMFAPMLGYTGNYGSFGLLGNCFWNPYGTFYYFSGFLGYAVFAHYLVRFPLNWSWIRTLWTAIPLFLTGYIITSFGFLEIQKIFPGDYSKLEVVWYFSGINVFAMTFAAFIIIQKIRINPSPLLAKIASLTFGIYLCHFFIVQVGYDVVYTWVPIPPYLQIPLIAIISFSVSLGLCWLISLNKWTRKAIM